MKTNQLTKLIRPAIFAVCVALASASAQADISSRTIGQAYKQVSKATAIVSFYIETDDGQRVEREVFVVLVSETGLAVTSIDYFPPTMRIDDIKDMTMSIGTGTAKKEYPAEFLGRDDDARVAFVRITSENPPRLDYIRFEQTELAPGDEVIVFSVLDKAVGYQRSFNAGRVNAVLEKPTKMYSTTADATGVPGAPVFDASGKPIGIYMNYTTSRTGIVPQRGAGSRPSLREGIVTVQIPVILPAERFMEMIKNPPKAGHERKWASVGVTALQALTADLAQYYGLPRGGVIVGQVVKGMPADKAGLKTEDIVLKYGALELKQDEDKVVETFSRAIRQSEIAKPVEMLVWRPSTKSQLTMTLTPEARPKNAAEAKRYTNRAFGFTAREIVADDLLNLRIEKLTGAFIGFIQSSSWAGQGQLQPGDVVQKINDTAVDSLESFQSAFEKAVKNKPKEIFFQVLRNGKETAIIRIEPRWETTEKE